MDEDNYNKLIVPKLTRVQVAMSELVHAMEKNKVPSIISSTIKQLFRYIENICTYNNIDWNS